MIYGISNLDILLFKRVVSSYKNKVERKVPKQATNPRKLFYNPKNTIV